MHGVGIIGVGSVARGHLRAVAAEYARHLVAVLTACMESSRVVLEA